MGIVLSVASLNVSQHINVYCVISCAKIGIFPSERPEEYRFQRPGLDVLPIPMALAIIFAPNLADPIKTRLSPSNFPGSLLALLHFSSSIMVSDRYSCSPVPSGSLCENGQVDSCINLPPFPHHEFQTCAMWCVCVCNLEG